MYTAGVSTVTRSLFRATKISRRVVPAFVVMASLIAVGCSDGTGSNDSPSGPPAEDRAYYILPPGNYGGLPTTQNSLDQLPLYDALTPLRGNVTDEDWGNLRSVYGASGHDYYLRRVRHSPYYR
jgi:hypothetical protein